MELSPALARYGFALGRWQGAWRFASPELRRAVALGQISAAWDVFRRDAGPGPVGRAHEEAVGRTAVTCTDDPRRDGMLLWLVDYGAPAIAEAAALLARMLGATRRFSGEEQELLQAAGDVLAAPSIGEGPVARAASAGLGNTPAIQGCVVLASAVDQLRRDPAFQEGTGEHTHHILPGGTLSRFVPSTPGAAWALNLALFARSASALGFLACPGMISRKLFRALEPEDLAVALIEGAAAALDAGYALFERMQPELERGRGTLASLSRNSRARETWTLVVALGGITRRQLAHAFGLSRAGADIQAHALAKAGLATLGPAGRIAWSPHWSPEAAIVRKADVEASSGAFAEFDASMAEIDRLLARTNIAR